MKRKLTPFIVIAGALSLALLAAACGGSSAGSNASGGYLGVATPAASTPAPGSTTVATAQTQLGRILADGGDNTLYLFERDEGGRSACTGACASQWPPLLTDGPAVAGTGATASLLGTTRRVDGTTQVTYAGHPLYRFGQDTEPGQTNGQGLDAFGAEWYVVSPAGDKVDGD